MKCLLQRVTQASVTVAGEVVGEIDQGLLVLVGVEPEDAEQTVTRMAERLLRYRVFSDAEGKMNLNVGQAGGAILLQSAALALLSTLFMQRSEYYKISSLAHLGSDRLALFVDRLAHLAGDLAIFRSASAAIHLLSLKAARLRFASCSAS